MWARFEQVAAERGDELAISNEFCAMSYRQLHAGARLISQFLGQMQQPVVVMALPGGPHLTLTQLGVWACEGVAVPISDKSTAGEAHAALQLLVPDVLVVQSLHEQQGVIDALAQPCTIISFDSEPVNGGMHRVVRFADLAAARPALVKCSPALPADARLVQFTSGSTAQPKGIVVSNANLCANLDMHRRHLQQFAGKHVFCPLPQYHAMGSAVVTEHLWHGSAVHMANGFVPGDDVARMQRHACVAILASPNYLKLMLHLRALDGLRLPALTAFTVGTAAVDAQLVGALHHAYPDAVVHCRYGLSESVGTMAMLSLRAGQQIAPGQLGALAHGVELLSDEHGSDHEIAVRSPANAIGQLIAPGRCQPLQDAQGILRTGDVGYLDGERCLYLTGRLSSFMKVNGFRVSPFEIESVLRDIPGVQEAIVVGTPDPMSGQRIVACLELYPSQQLPDNEALRRHCQQRLSKHKLPQRFVVFPRLPRTQVGKPNRSEILMEISQ